MSRSLAAYAIQFLAGVTPEVAAKAVTDAGDDNGIDAIHFDASSKRLYLVQSKWIKDGTGEPENGDVKKFLAGVRDLLNLQFDRFNAKVRAKEIQVTEALNEPGTVCEVVIVYTGANKLAPPSRRDLDDLSSEMNDTSEVLTTTVLHQGALFDSLIASTAGEPINLEINLKSWGRVETPHMAFYGQVNGQLIAAWWAKYRARLFAKNLRGTLGETEVNTEMRKTLEQRPADFWYFNNGITIVARRAQKAMAGGATHDFANLHCDDISVVNGAQTVGTIGKYAETNPKVMEQVFVNLRIIVRGDDQTFGEEVTKTNNRHEVDPILWTKKGHSLATLCQPS